MTPIEQDKAIQDLGRILMEFAPDAPEKVAAADFFKEVLTDCGEMKTRAILGLVDAIHDGLAYGNWPWVSFVKD
jgi:hypothetical protein